MTRGVRVPSSPEDETDEPTNHSPSLDTDEINFGDVVPIECFGSPQGLARYAPCYILVIVDCPLSLESAMYTGHLS